MPSTAITSPCSSASKAKVVRGLLEGLLAGRWRGGDRFTEAFGVETFGVSRTPVREALLELQALGLVELRRNCGAIVLPFGEEELRDLYAVRSLLEVESARLAATRVDPGQWQNLILKFEEIRNSGGEDQNWEVDRELHRLIAEGSGNRRLTSETSRYSTLVQTMREIVAARALGIHSASVDEHLEILCGLQAQNPDKAVNAMSDHLQQASDSAVAAMLEARES